MKSPYLCVSIIKVWRYSLPNIINYPSEWVLCVWAGAIENKYIFLLRHLEISKHSICIQYAQDLFNKQWHHPPFNTQVQRLDRVQQRALERHTTREERVQERVRKRGLNPSLSSGTAADPLMQRTHTGSSTHTYMSMHCWVWDTNNRNYNNRI